MAIRSYRNISPTIDQSTYIDEQACVIGDVVMGKDCSVWPMTVIRGDVNIVRIGDRTNVQDGTVVHVTHGYSEVPEGYDVRIGNDVTIGHNVTVHGCNIEDKCLIGIGSTLLDGAIIGEKVLLGAGSLVTEGKELQSGHLYMGRPARKIRELTDEEFKWFEYSAKHYVSLKNDYL
ncbi:MAG: gamma carbonic anhydrase family protein [Gammaproteobacteria bacterium]|nr:MAG: gamma carbonic anhydrase family protein [Gammaproteobacteria bacterium]